MADLNALPIEFSVGGHDYRARRLDAMTQWHIARRLSPLAASMTSLAASMSATPEDGEDQPSSMSDALFRALKKDGADSALKVAAQTLADMKDEDSEYILHNCLKVVDRKANNGGAWLPVWNASANKPQFLDINMAHMLKIAMEVLKDSLGGFFPELLSILSAPSPQ